MSCGKVILGNELEGNGVGHCLFSLCMTLFVLQQIQVHRRLRPWAPSYGVAAMSFLTIIVKIGIDVLVVYPDVAIPHWALGDGPGCQ